MGGQKLWVVLWVLHSGVRRMIERIRSMRSYFARTALFPVQNRNPYHSLVTSLSQAGGFHLGSQLSFPLVPSVLEPNLNLCLCQVKLCCQASAFGRGEIPLHVESRLQLIDLTSGEHRSCFLLPPFLVDIFLVALRRLIVFFYGVCKREVLNILDSGKKIWPVLVWAQ